jgi:hypothetical protein
MKKLSLLSCFTLIFMWITASAIGKEFSLVTKPPLNWTIDPDEKPSKGSFASISYVPPKGRDAWFTIKEIGEVGDLPYKGKNIKNIHIWWLRQLRYTAPNDENIQEIITPHGKYLLSIIEDQNLKGKPIIPNDYKFTIYITGVVDGRYVVSCALLSQQMAGIDLDEAKASLNEIKK